MRVVTFARSLRPIVVFSLLLVSFSLGHAAVGAPTSATSEATEAGRFVQSALEAGFKIASQDGKDSKVASEKYDWFNTHWDISLIESRLRSALIGASDLDSATDVQLSSALSRIALLQIGFYIEQPFQSKWSEVNSPGRQALARMMGVFEEMMEYGRQPTSFGLIPLPANFAAPTKPDFAAAAIQIEPENTPKEKLKEGQYVFVLRRDSKVGLRLVDLVIPNDGVSALRTTRDQLVGKSPQWVIDFVRNRGL